jgi:spore coat polysaccharide biosynthesis predicted glycosyltransferase SpsG
MINLLTLTEGGAQIGFGHLSRCSEILNHFANKGWETSLYVDWREEGLFPFQEYCSFSWKNLKDVLTSIDASKCCLVDSYLASKHDLNVLKEHFDRVIALDDFKRMDTFGVDLIINPNPFGDQFNYQDFHVGGSDYVILREALKNKIKHQQEVHKDIESILLTVGGSDYRNLLPKITDAFKSATKRLEVVCGNNEIANELASTFSAYKNLSFHSYVSAGNLAGIFNNVDLAISAGGQTLHELAYAGIPTIGICIDTDQVPNLNFYYEKGFLVNHLQWDQRDLIDRILNDIHQLNFEARLKHSQIGRSLVDGNGIEAIFRKISEINEDV